MSTEFFSRPILNSPYEYPVRHWELDPEGQPTGREIQSRRAAEFITPIPAPRKVKGKKAQTSLDLDEGKGLSNQEQQYAQTSLINDLRNAVDKWRLIPNPGDWQVTPETARLVQ